MAMAEPACAKEELKDIAECIAEGREDSSIIYRLTELSNHYHSLEQWTQPSSSLNLLQLAVLHKQRKVVEHLCGYHGNFMQKGLYLKTVGANEDSDDSVEQDMVCVEASQQPDPPPATEKSTNCPSAMHASTQQQLLLPEADSSHNKGQHEQCLVNHPLHLACWTGDMDSVKLLTRAGTGAGQRKNSSCPDSKTHREDKYRQTEHLKDLMKSVCVLTSDASASKEHVQGLPLELAVMNGSISCVKFLLSRVLLRWISSQYCFLFFGLNPKTATLHLACCLSDPKLVALLLPSLSKDAVHCRDAEGQTPLHVAVWIGDVDTVRLLLQHGADVNAQTHSGSTCLHILFRSKIQPYNIETVMRVLLEYGAHLTLFDKSELHKHPGFCSLHVLAMEFAEFSKSSSLLWNVKLAEKLSAYTCSKLNWDAKNKFDDLEYLESLVRCMRLLLQADVDPNIPVIQPGAAKNALEIIMRTRNVASLLERFPDVVLSAVYSLLEFGATGDLNYISQSLKEIRNNDHQIAWMHLLCQCGVTPDIMCSTFTSMIVRPYGPFPLDPSCVVFLANWMSPTSIPTLQAMLPLLHPEQRQNCSDVVMSPVYGSPVRSLRHSCKVTVWRCLGCRSTNVDVLHLPDIIKSYLKADIY